MGKKRIVKKSDNKANGADKIDTKSEIKETDGKEVVTNSGKQLPVLEEEALCKKFDEIISGDSIIPEEGIQAARDMYLDLAVLQKKIETRTKLIKIARKRLDTDKKSLNEAMEIENEELTKIKVLRDRMKSLSEELGKSKESLLNEAKESGEREQIRRKTMNDDFLAKIKGISSRLDENTILRKKAIEDNETLKENLKQILIDFQNMEKQFNSKMTAYDAKIIKLQKKLATEEGILEEEQLNVQNGHERLEHLQKTEADLRIQLTSYIDRFDQFQEELIKSNESFGFFKSRMEEMTHTIKALEDDSTILSEHAASSLKAYQVAIAEKEKIQSDVEITKKQVEKLLALVPVLEKDIEDKKRELLIFKMKNNDHYDSSDNNNTDNNIIMNSDNNEIYINNNDQDVRSSNHHEVNSSINHEEYTEDITSHIELTENSDMNQKESNYNNNTKL